MEKRMIQDLDWNLLYTIDTLSLEYIWKWIVPNIEKDMIIDAGRIDHHIHAVKSSDILIQPNGWYDDRQEKWRFTMRVYREVDCRHHKYMGTLPMGLITAIVSNNFPDIADYDSGGGVPNRAVKNENGDYEVYIWYP